MLPFTATVQPTSLINILETGVKKVTEGNESPCSKVKRKIRREFLVRALPRFSRNLDALVPILKKR